MGGDRPDAARLLLLAHGSPGPAHAPAVRAVATAVAGTGTPCDVAFLDHDSPDPDAAAAALPDRLAGPVVVVPLLLNRAYHAAVDVPAAADRVRAARPGVDVRVAGPLGPDPALLTALERRLAEAGATPDAPVVLLSSGTSDAAARDAVESLARRWGDRRGRPVRAAFASGDGTTPAEAVASLRAGTTGTAPVVAALLLAGGTLLDRAAAQAREAGAAHVTAPLVAPAPTGGHEAHDVPPELVGLVLARARDAVAPAGEDG